jgi:hypothetical protein
MSIRVWGSFVIGESRIPERELSNLLFSIAHFAANNKIGVKLGHNINTAFYKEYSGNNKSLLFELVDHPGMDVAEILFSGDGVTIHYGVERVDFGESLNSRMSRVQRFLKDVFTLINIEKIEFHVYGFIEAGYSKTQEISIDDFVRIVEQIFLDTDNQTPDINLVISR